jgi:L-alanine-DL-glutamate epimerase-like enolase superfamily enzyme
MNPKAATIQEVERIVLDVPFHPRCAEAMTVYGPGWSIVELCKITTASGVVGIGETIQGYTWKHSTDAEFDRVRGRNLFDFLWDDSLGAGLQMALFDAAGNLTGVPCHRLLGNLHRDEVPLSWWAQSMAPTAWAAEAEAAQQHGFTSMKVKARPWYDITAQLDAVSAVVPPHFKLDTDFNGMLLGVDVAAPLLSRLEKSHPNLAILESPLPQDDVAGNALLRQKIDSPIAMHFGVPPIMTAIKEGVCDGFVVGGGAHQIVSEGTIAAKAKMPFWLQMVGTGLTTAFSAHLGAVLEQARWPAINCINIYSHTLLKKFTVTGGHLAVPQAPGLGVEIDWDAVEKYRVAPDYKKETPRQIHTVSWPDGRTFISRDGGFRAMFVSGKLTGFVPGMSLDIRLDDGGEDFAAEYAEHFGKD